MYNWPIDLSILGSPQKMTNQCEEVIEELEEVSSAGGTTIRILPTFEMSNETGLKKLKIYDQTKKVFINEEAYVDFELHWRPIYISKDSPDKRPFIYWGGIEPFNGANSKTYLEQLIVGPMQDPRTKVKYIDNDLCNLKTSNITFEPKEIKNPIAQPVLEPKTLTNDTIIAEGVTISSEEKEALNIAIFGGNKKEEDDKSILVDTEKVLDMVKLQKIFSNIDESRGLTPLEHQYLSNGKIDSGDANRLRHSWLGISKYPTKQGDRYSATLKGVTIKSGFAHPLDAARAYNNFVLKHGLPYPVNNIPGFLDLEVLEHGKYSVLRDYEPWQLIEEGLKRIKPEEEKF